MSGHGPGQDPDVHSAPAWAWSSVVLIAALAFAASTVLISVTAWQIHRAELEEHRALYLASAVAAVARLAGDDSAQPFIEALASQTPDITEAFVIAQGTTDEYGISRGQSYSATMDTSERGAVVGPLAAADPRTHPEARRHKLRYDRYARAVTGLDLTPEPGRASPRYALALDERGPELLYSAQVAVERKQPAAAGVAIKAAVPSPPIPWFLFVAMMLGLWALGIGVFHFGGDRLGDAKKRSIALVALVLVGMIAFYAGGRAVFESHLGDQVERRLSDVRAVHKAGLDSGLTPIQAAIIAVEADVDFTGTRGLLLGDQTDDLIASIGAAPDRLFAGRYRLAAALLLGVLAALALLFVFAHRFLIKTVVAGRENPYAYMYVLPSMTGMIILVFIPFVTGVGLSFFAYEAPRYYFAGLSNYAEILIGSEAGDVTFYWTLFVTLLWTFLNVLLHASIGLGLALLLKSPTLRFKKIYRVLLIIPWAIPNYITALIWKGMFNKEFGAVNRFIESIQGLMGMEPAGVDWLGGSFATAFTANLVTNTWLGFPFMMVVALGALQSIPDDLYEAADVDGASPWQKFRHITLPLLKPALFPAIILGAIWTFNMFNVIYLVSGGGPDHSTEILITDAYRAFAMLNRYGLAAAYSVLIFVILFLYTLMTNRITRATEGAFE